MAEGRPLRFFTLTCRPAGQTLAECLQHLLDSFKRLRHAKEWGKAVDGGIATVEVTRGAARDHWHVHLHGLFVGRFLDQRRLSELWRVASRGSYVVHVRAVGDHRRELEYVASYAAKGWERRLLDEPSRCDECLTTMKGRRLLMTWGSWYNADIEQEPADTREFREVGRLSQIVAAATKGDLWAVGIMKALGVRVEGGDGSVRMLRADKG